ncbi:phage uncharacterized protein (putative large terminase), C-terminal domain-containing protein [Pseudarcicella hirudinis]|uniref:Phage uncharacterized protein (Putative large terminase), C-terminal domain-containing protein n=1 Tax=Pseudarcicella hirudinis TaxID=1079859 RepID=A0A1I5MXX2_9BACT|nr:hypothetical protein [Pseudarcicella hirudinis]SFP13966.1 phage uncharacterized protein (putative large terminase), C-terminal domain-containing protein [Pseudarcicella hirudinis]
MITTKDKQALEAYQAVKLSIGKATEVILDETESQKEKRVAELLKPKNFEAFCDYYFPHLKTAPFGWFHKRGAKEVLEDNKHFGVWEFPREHAKSTLALMLFINLYFAGEITGLVLTSQSADKAETLLSRFQAEFEANARLINDFGSQKNIGDWSVGQFSTIRDVGFWAFGVGQSPRGVIVGGNRPNACLVDDVDTPDLCRNLERVTRTVDWIMGDLWGACAIKQARFLCLGNGIHQKSVLRHIVGDTEIGMPKKPGVRHLKVYALENPKTHAKDQSEKGVPAWKENYLRGQLDLKLMQVGYRVAQREYFHKHIIDGTVFKKEWVNYVPVKSLADCQVAVSYVDPSYKDTKRNDFKAIVATTRIGTKIVVVGVWVRQASVSSMVTAHYDMDLFLKSKGLKLHICYMEANMMQDTHLTEYVAQKENFGYMLPIRADTRKKPDKTGRIENMTPLFERGIIVFADYLRNTPDLIAFLEQLLGFPNAHDDAPDALEGSENKLNEHHRSMTQPPETGGTRRTTTW